MPRLMNPKTLLCGILKPDQAPLQLPWFLQSSPLILDIISDQIFQDWVKRGTMKGEAYRLQMQVIILEAGTGVVLASGKCELL